MGVPANCWECQHRESCRAPHYGGSKCEYAKEITVALIAAIQNQNPKGGKHNGN